MPKQSIIFPCARKWAFDVIVECNLRGWIAPSALPSYLATNMIIFETNIGSIGLKPNATNLDNKAL